MLQQLKCDLKLYKEELLGPAVFALGGFLLGAAACALIMFLVPDPGTWFCLGSLIAMIGMCMYAIAYAFYYHRQCWLALAMGRTRKGILLSYALRVVLGVGLGYGLLVLLNRVEMAVGSRLYADYPLEVEFSFLYDWRLVLGLLVGTPVVCLFIGSLFSRFGKKATVPMYFIWLAGCIALPRFTHEESIVGQLLRSIPGWGWGAAGITALAAMTVTVVLLSRKQAVR